MLSPYRVLDLTDDRGHLAGLILAQLGADVIAIEPSGGQRARHQGPFCEGDSGNPETERSLTHWAFNRGKRNCVHVYCCASTASKRRHSTAIY